MTPSITRVQRPGTVNRFLLAANMNITTDQAIPLRRPCRFVCVRVQPLIMRASISLTTATGAFYAGAGKTSAITTAAALSALTGAQTGAGSVTPQTVQNNYILDQDDVYFACTVAQGAAATADLMVQIVPLWDLS